MPKMFMSNPAKIKYLADVVQRSFCEIVGHTESSNYCDRNIYPYSPDEVDFILESVTAMVNAYLKEPTPEQVERRKKYNARLKAEEDRKREETRCISPGKSDDRMAEKDLCETEAEQHV
ncbi:MAG: hypothetical protein ABFC57_12740 [Veillonellales bacterium]